MTNERAQIVAKLTDLKKRSSAVTAQFAERMAEIERQVGGGRMVTVIGGDDGLVASVDIDLRAYAAASAKEAASAADHALQLIRAAAVAPSPAVTNDVIERLKQRQPVHEAILAATQSEPPLVDAFAAQRRVVVPSSDITVGVDGAGALWVEIDPQFKESTNAVEFGQVLRSRVNEALRVIDSEGD